MSVHSVLSEEKLSSFRPGKNSARDETCAHSLNFSVLIFIQRLRNRAAHFSETTISVAKLSASPIDSETLL